MAIVLCEINGKVIQQMSLEIVDKFFEKFGERISIGVNLIDSKPKSSNFPIRMYTTTKSSNNFPIKPDSFGNYTRLPFVHQNSAEI